MTSPEVDVVQRFGTKVQYLESPKWLVRKEALETFLQLLEDNPQISSSSMTSYGELMDILKKIVIKDTNINVVTVALKVLAGLARRLDTNFQCFVAMILPHILSRAKDKKAVMQASVSEALDSISLTCDSSKLTKDLSEALGQPSPPSKICICQFLYRYFIRNTVSSQEFVQSVIPLIVKLASDGDPDVRNAACSALGSAKRGLGPKIDRFLKEITDDAKISKLNEACEQAVTEWKQWQSEQGNTVLENGTIQAGDVQAIGDEAGTDVTDSATVEDPWESKEIINISSLLKSSFNTLIASSKWLERKQALDELVESMADEPRLNFDTDLEEIIKTILKVLEKDSNINVSAIASRTLTKISQGVRSGLSSYVNKILRVCLDKMKEKKAVLRNELISLSDALSLSADIEVYMDGIEYGMTAKNPQSRAQTCVFLSRFFANFEKSFLPLGSLKQLSSWIIRCSSDGDVEVREAALNIIATISKCGGDPTSKMFFASVFDDSLKSPKIAELITKVPDPDPTTSMILKKMYANKNQITNSSVHTKAAKAPPSKPISRPAATPRPKPAVVRPATAKPVAKTGLTPRPPTAASSHVPSRPATASVTRPVHRALIRPTPVPSSARAVPTPKPAVVATPRAAPRAVPSTRPVDRPPLVKSQAPTVVSARSKMPTHSTSTTVKSGIPRPPSGIRPPSRPMSRSGSLSRLPQPT